jgi:hypothetical protein
MSHIKQIKEVIGNRVDDHIISAQLENNNFDIQKTIDFFLEHAPSPSPGRRNEGKGKERVKDDSRYERRDKREKRSSLPTPLHEENSQGLWSTVAKKNTKHAQAFDPVIQRKAPGHGQPHPPPVQPPMQPQVHAQGVHPGFAKSFGLPDMGIQSVNTNEMVEILAVAISRQLAEIQEKSRMLQEMQNELTTITSDNSSELNDLMHEKRALIERESMLEMELRQVKDKLQHIEVSIGKAEKEKALRVKELASKSQVVGIVRGLAPNNEQQ